MPASISLSLKNSKFSCGSVSTVREHAHDASRQRARCLTNERHQILTVVRAFVRNDDRGDGHRTDINCDMRLYPTTMDVPLLSQPRNMNDLLKMIKLNIMINVARIRALNRCINGDECLHLVSIILMDPR